MTTQDQDMMEAQEFFLKSMPSNALMDIWQEGGEFSETAKQILIERPLFKRD
jgi:hypothetical protein